MQDRKIKLNKYKDYKRCKQCDLAFKNHEDATKCPFCQSTKYVVNLLKEDKK